MFLLTNLALVLFGLVILIWSADRLVLAASSLAQRHGVSPLVVGVLIVGFGTSAPEMFISAVSSLNDQSGIALGNAIGSNIANVGMVLAAAALISPLAVSAVALRREYPVLLIITAGCALLFLDGSISRLDGALLFGALIGLIALLMHVSKRDKSLVDALVGDDIPEPTMGERAAIGWLLVSLVLLPLSSQMLVTGASAIAAAMGVDPVIIGLTMVAIGTSLPELAAAVASALRKEHELIVGNIIGSNVFNLLGVLGIAGLLRPLSFSTDLLYRDYLIMALYTGGLWVLVGGWRKQAHLSRWAAAILLLGFVAYMVMLASMERALPAVA